MAEVQETPWNLDTYRQKYAELAEVARRRIEEGRRSQRLATLLYDLDRCEHGRHQGDVCSGESGCNGPSRGNPHIKAGDVIGYTMSRQPIVMPERAQRHDPDAWIAGAGSGPSREGRDG